MHEAGHLLALWLLLPDSVVDHVELNPETGDGHVRARIRYDVGADLDTAPAGPPTVFLADRLVQILAGNAAEKVASLTGHAGPGSGPDLAAAHELARMMINGLHRRPDGSLTDSTLHHIEDAAARAEALLTQHRAELNQTAAELGATRSTGIGRHEVLAIQERVMGSARIPEWAFQEDARAAVRALINRSNRIQSGHRRR